MIINKEKILSFNVLFLYVASLWLWLGWACMGEWLKNPDYQYGLFILPIGFYFLLSRQSSFLFYDDSCGGSKVAWNILFATAFLVFPIEIFRLSPLYWRLLLWIIGLLAASASLASAYLLGGRAFLRVVIFPVGFMLLAIPWPSFIEQRTTLPLMHAVANIVGEVTLFLGMPAKVMGTTIALPNCTVGIAEACSGIRSFQTALIISLAVGELYLLTFPKRIALLISAAVLAFLGNVVRTFLLTWIGIRRGTIGIEHWHDGVAWTFLLVLIVLIFALALILRNTKRTIMPSYGTRAQPRNTEHLSVTKPRYLFLIALIGLLCAHGWYWFRGEMGAKPERMIVGAKVLENPEIQKVEVQPEVLSILAPTEGEYFMAQTKSGLDLSAYHFYWAPSRSTAFQVYHRPDICMPGAGWNQLGNVTRMDIRREGKQESWYVFHYVRSGIGAFLLWQAWMDGHAVNFQFDEKMAVQRNAAMDFILRGKKKVSYEVAAVFIAYEGDTLPEDLARQAIDLFFGDHANPTGR